MNSLHFHVRSSSEGVSHKANQTPSERIEAVASGSTNRADAFPPTRLMASKTRSHANTARWSFGMAADCCEPSAASTIWPMGGNPAKRCCRITTTMARCRCSASRCPSMRNHAAAPFGGIGFPPARDSRSPMHSANSVHILSAAPFPPCGDAGHRRTSVVAASSRRLGKHSLPVVGDALPNRLHGRIGASFGELVQLLIRSPLGERLSLFKPNGNPVPPSVEERGRP